jgi:ABC-type multidrug transport system ATPase subunit
MTFTGRLEGTGSLVNPHVVVFDSSVPRRVSLEPQSECTFGTDENCTVRLPFGHRIFPQHARLSYYRGAWHLRKLYEPAEITLDNRVIDTLELHGGEVFLLGDIRVEFRHPGAMTPRPRQSAPEPVLARPRHPLAAATSIGRDPQNDLVLPHPQVSRFHASIIQRGDRWLIQDLGSTNGTFLNGMAATSPLPLAPGDTISISDFVFHFDGAALEQESQEGRARIDAIDLRRVVGEGQVILQDVSLSIYPREFVAIVGVSGAGKSTLMSALSGFHPADSGSVYVNGIDFYQHFDAFRPTLGYVPQDDIIHRELTVVRALHYAALLRMPEDSRPAEIERRLDEVLNDLQLTERRDVAIGRLSGGQRKRVSIGVELLTKPRLFYLDEPTSGLDPGLEAEMMQIFRRMADQGHTTLVITHATKNLLLADQVVFLARGGHLAYFGPPQDALDYFGAEDFVDIYLKLERERSPEQWGRDFKRSSHYQSNVQRRLKEAGLPAPGNQVAMPPPARSAAAGLGTPKKPRLGSGVRQLGILMSRYMEILARDTRNLMILLAQAPIMATLLLFAYPSDVLSYNVGDYNRAKSLIFFLVCISIWFGTSNSAREIAKEAAIWRRERTVNLGIFPYVLSKVIVLLGLAAVQGVVMLGMVSLKVVWPALGWALYAKLYLVFVLVAAAGLTMGLMCSALVSNPDKAASLVPILLIPQIVFSGAMMPLEGVSEWISYLTISKWGLELMGNIIHIWKIPLVTWPYVRLSPETAFDIEPRTHYWVLCGYVALFVVATCYFLKRKDSARES